MTSTDHLIRRGTILIYRVFDRAEEIDLPSLEKLITQGRGDSRVRISAGKSQAIIVRNAPVRIHLGEMEIQLGGQSFKSDAVATVWDYGVISVCMQVPLNQVPWSTLLSYASVLSNHAETIQEIDNMALMRVDELSKMIGPAMKRPQRSEIVEDYIIYFLEDIANLQQASDLITTTDLSAMILGEAREQLSDRARDSILQNLFQYSTRDFVLIDWNSAIVLEPSGERDIADVLEFALTHLLEVRYYDDLLDKRLTELYNSIEAGRQKIWKSKFAMISRDANTKFIELSEFMERIDNSLKVVGDFYLATLFRGAARRFRILDWQQSITRKMNMLARVSELLQGETNVLRGHFLEIIVILLILFEIVSAILIRNSAA